MELHEECGVFGVYDPAGDCARTAYYGLYALQHRGQEACGIAAINDRELSYHKDAGLVGEVFHEAVLDRLNGTMAVGHVRYSTTGGTRRENAQPLTLRYVKGTLALAHNGNLPHADQLRAQFEYQGAIFQTTSDSELIAYAIAQARLRCPSVEDGQVRTVQPPSAGGGHLCIFEYIYFARPDSTICGQSVHQARLRAGRFLAQEHPAEADVVIGVPDSGLDAALGYAEASGIPYGVGLVKNRYIGRTFITPGQGRREQAVRIKLGALRSCVEGKRVVMVDDSIVRGTTSRQIVSLLREAGAAEVHLRSSAPPFTAPCYFGTDIPDKEELIACRCSVEEIRARTGADSLGFLSLDALKRIAPDAVCGFCDGCFTGKYPMPL